MSSYPDQVRWFEALGACGCGCGKPGTGILRGLRNESHGPYTARCAEKRIKAAEKAREKYAVEKARAVIAKADATP